ncbi:MAG TPA: homogentisate 1,2-dioxygenase [Polyangiales bacterium]|jgi:homogentisate 1,2-dioxygenase|nr:homogentisate 1,2-dioxygenase [Polyangiales bacterium]
MLDRIACGDIPRKHHVAARSADGALRYEECLTRAGFDGPYSILYHEHRPHALLEADTPHTCASLHLDAPAPTLRRRHFRTGQLLPARFPIDARTPLLHNADVTIGAQRVTDSDPVYFVNADADELLFVHEGQGSVRSVFGELSFARYDYVCIPKGVLHRVIVQAPGAWLLRIECRGGLGIPKQFRNEVGQLRMDAPYCHRDFRRPVFAGPVDEGLRELVIKRGDVHHGFRSEHSPLDVVGWDGSVYPWAFPIAAFQPRVSSVHLPPTWHGTFAARGALICSFVPRPLDFAADAVPCPYPHSSVDVDEVLFYASGEFGSRSGIEAGSVTLHPAGIPHGPHPGRYERSADPSTRAKSTDELAVMLDCYTPLAVTAQASHIEDPSYDGSFTDDRQ